MRVALVCPYAWDLPGGVQSHVRSLAPALSARGHDVTVLAPTAKDARSTGSEGYVLELVGATVPVPANGSVAPISFGPRTARAVRRQVEEMAPDVIHVHEPLIPSLSLLALGATAAPAVGTFHAARDKSAGYRAARPWLRKKAEELTLRTAVSTAARDLAARYFPGDYLLTPNGIDAARFAAAEPLDLGDKKTVLFVGRIEKRKGLEVLVQALASMSTADVRLVVVGDGPRLRAARKLASELHVDSAWLGRLDDADLARAYRAADVFCAPNLGGESFGIVLLEAMAAGAAVVCSDLDAFKHVARDAALYAPPGNAQALAGRLRAAVEDGKSERVDAGRRRAARFDWANLAQDVEGVYEHALGSARISG